MMTAKEFAINAHRNTNHMYDEYLPYEFHLRMVVEVATKFINLVDAADRSEVLYACWLHDVIEDCRVNYKEIERNFGTYVAEIVRACTNVTRGRNRSERMPYECYEDIKTVPYALFVKLCDRIANVQYSKMTGSSMFEMYQKEYSKFRHRLYFSSTLDPMWDYLESILLNDKS